MFFYVAIVVLCKQQFFYLYVQSHEILVFTCTTQVRGVGLDLNVQ